MIRKGKRAWMLAVAVGWVCGAWGCACPNASDQKMSVMDSPKVKISRDGKITIEGEGKVMYRSSNGEMLTPEQFDKLW